MPKCPNCTQNVPKKQRFCGFCGTDITTGERPEDIAIFDSLGKHVANSPDAVEESYFAKQRREALASGVPIVEPPKLKVEVPPDIARSLNGKQVDETELEMRMKGVWQDDVQSEKIAEKLKNKENSDVDVALANSKKNREFLKDLPPIGVPKTPTQTGTPKSSPVKNSENISPMAESQGNVNSSKNAAPLQKNSPKPEFNTIFNKPEDKPFAPFTNSQKSPSVNSKFSHNEPVTSNANAPKTSEKAAYSKFDDFDKLAPSKKSQNYSNDSQNSKNNSDIQSDVSNNSQKYSDTAQNKFNTFQNISSNLKSTSDTLQKNTNNSKFSTQNSLNNTKNISNNSQNNQKNIANNTENISTISQNAEKTSLTPPNISANNFKNTPTKNTDFTEKTVENVKKPTENISKEPGFAKKSDNVAFEFPSSEIKKEVTRENIFIEDEEKTVKVPNVTGITKESAQELISKIGLKAVLKTVNDVKAPKGTIVSQDVPEGQSVDTGTLLTLFVSVGDWSKWTKDPYISDEKHQIEEKNIYRHRSREQIVEYRESDKNVMQNFDLYDSKKDYTSWEMDDFYSKDDRQISDTCEILKISTGFKYFGWIYKGSDSIPQVYCSLQAALLFNPRTMSENWEYNETIDRFNPEAELKVWSPKGGFVKSPAGDEVVSNINFSTYYVGGIEYAAKVGNIDTVWTKYRKRKLKSVTYLFKTEKYSEWSPWSDWSLEQEIEPDDLHELEVQTLFRRRRKADIQKD
jgi:hypothetical protein